ncbi:PQQ-binding-like beta-propeller repeat protein [Enemella sp. A6]|uniref:outer membrane protein assembly factor BamB family protein n=1 Tax=Enemella sp. A6 TaxID=3440152 RepID=UPI003EBB6B5B
MAPDPPGGYSAGGVRPTWQQDGPAVVTPEWAKDRARHRPAEPPPPPPPRFPAPPQQQPEGAPPPKPEKPARRRRYELPVALVLVLGVLAAMAALTMRSAAVPDDFPHNAATDLWPVDGAALDVDYTLDSTTEQGVIEHARLLGEEAIVGIPSPLAASLYPPEGDVRTAHFWRQVSTGDELDRRVHLRQATTGGTMLFGQSWGERGIVFHPPVREVPHDVAADQSWESKGEARIDIVRRVQQPYTNTSSASTPADAGEADRGCLVITSQTEMEHLRIEEESLWCPGAGIVRQSGRWNQQRYEFTPADPRPIGAEDRESAPLLKADASDPAQWQTGWLDAAVETDGTFDTQPALVVPFGAPVAGDTGYLHVPYLLNGDVMSILPAAEDGADYSAGTGLLIWRGHAGGQVTAVGTHGRLTTATSNRRTLTVFGDDGARRWTADLSDVAMSAPVSLGPDRIAVATLDGRVRMFDVGNGQEIWNTAASDEGIANPLATDGTSVAAVDAGFTLLLLDADTGELLSDDVGFGQPIADVALADGVVLVAAGGVSAIDARTGDMLWESTLSVPNRLAISGGRVLVGTPNRMRFLDLTTGATIADVPTGQQALVAIDGGFLTLADGQVHLWSTDGTKRHSWSLEGSPADTLTVGAGRVWALDRETMTGWWVQP